MFASKDTLLTRPSGYSIARSVRLRSSASAYLNRTPATAGNTTTWTWSSWIKRGLISDGNYRAIIEAYTGASSVYCDIAFNNDQIWINQDNGSGGVMTVYTTAVYRDPASWYHLVVAVDTTQATSTNRVKIYMNGVQQSVTFGNAPSQNLSTWVNSANPHKIASRWSAVNTTNGFDGYLTEVNLIDGQALTPSSFGETDSITGVWKPKAYSGTYGTNGFYLNFSDNSNNTAATIGKDYSGNGNNWTPNNVQTYDSVPDTPSNNFCVMNPLYNGGSGTSWSNGNLTSTIAVSQSGITAATFGVSSGKWYWEIVASPTTPPSLCVGIIKTSFTPIGDVFLGYQSEGYGYYSYDGRKVNNSSFSSYGSSWEGAQFVIGIALDMDAGTIVFYRNNVSQGTAFSSLSGTFTFAASDGGATAGTTFYVNFGADSSFAGQKTAQTNTDANGLGNFFYAVPSGYLALCTQNLPASTITNGAAYMAATLYTGNSPSSQTVSNAVNSVSFQPDLVWQKSRTQTYSNVLYDSVRGVQKRLSSNETAAESTASTAVTAFTSSGFTTGADGEMNDPTGGSNNHVAWMWKAGGTSASNTNGTITSTVSVGATQGFSVVTYTGTGVTATIGHGLGVAPQMVIVKNRAAAESWRVGHSFMNSGSSPWSYYMNLNGTGAQVLESAIWNNTAPTSTVFTISNDSAVSGNGQSHVAYCFAAVAGYSAFGSYTGNGSTDGPFIYTGFRPRFILVKTYTTTQSWQMYDSARDTYNQVTNTLFANASNAESSTNGKFDFLSNGFKMRDGDFATNKSGESYIYMAFAEVPFRSALAR